eukprot:CAMPEP_0181226012 /NCGR_PEP_ID=MMETSP1096-20121128/32023_1 /TAXON_ID=156174 ORGANISM="Chrysochromulina ericina, Strain CCMP281" /NCGR_SAMPLE_ID=MMETSP1096 /ASSEMBLY_ACC=CAM_ASM_000453 /LENGTH=42 /DNA_ID= /DNA_START= /DNA_END= /DNA_ORIENTATION=
MKNEPQQRQGQRYPTRSPASRLEHQVKPAGEPRGCPAPIPSV